MQTIENRHPKLEDRKRLSGIFGNDAAAQQTSNFNFPPFPVVCRQQRRSLHRISAPSFVFGSAPNDASRCRCRRRRDYQGDRRAALKNCANMKRRHSGGGGGGGGNQAAHAAPKMTYKNFVFVTFDESSNIERPSAVTRARARACGYTRQLQQFFSSSFSAFCRLRRSSLQLLKA